MSSRSLNATDLQVLIEREKNEEPILIANPNRYGTIPVADITAWSFYKRAEKVIWPADEIDWTVDIQQWEGELTANERNYLSKTLSFFYGVDGIIMENIACRFLTEIQCPSSRAFYSVQIFDEQVHNEAYGKALFNLVTDPVERDTLMKGLQNDPYIKKKGDWGMYYKTKATTFAERLLAFGIVEGIFFQASFCAIFFFKKRGLMPGLVFSNTQISKDENLHFEFAAYRYRTLTIAKLPIADFHEVVKSAVEIEMEYVQSLLPVKLIGMNADLMIEYLKYTADRFCIAFGVPIIYEAKNPFDWMELISMDGKTNFFEHRVAEYQRFIDTDQSMYYEVPTINKEKPKIDIALELFNPKTKLFAQVSSEKLSNLPIVNINIDEPVYF